MNNDARSKLRSMGGIMASSPELMQVAQKFNNGGPVAQEPPMAGRLPFMPRPIRGPMSLNRSLNDPGPTPIIEPPLAGTIPVVPREMLGDARRRALAGTAPSFGMGMGAGLGSLNPILEDDIGVDDLLSEARLDPAPRPRPATPPAETDGTPPAVKRQNDLRRSRNLGPMSPEQEAELLRAEVDRLKDTTDDARAGRGFGRIGDVVARATPDPEKTKDLLPRVEDILNNEPPPGGGGDTPRPQAKRDLRSRYKEKLELFKEIYGTDDKDEAQDRAMSLAMIGLAIAAGQSPNALTNIAQGAMVGLQGMGAQREAARDRERGMRTLALETAIGQQEAEASAEAEAANMEQEQANRIELEREKARLTGPGGSGAEALRRSPASRIYGDALTSVLSQIDKEEIYPPEGVDPTEFAKSRAVSVALDTLELNVAEGLIDPETATRVRSELRSIGGAQTAADPNVQARVDEALKNYTPDQVRKGLADSGIDPTLYGL